MCCVRVINWRAGCASRADPASQSVLELSTLDAAGWLALAGCQHPRLKEEEQYYKSDRGSSISSWCLTLVPARTLLCVWVCVSCMCASAHTFYLVCGFVLGLACVRDAYEAKRECSPIISPHTARLNVRMIDISWGRPIIVLQNYSYRSQLVYNHT